MRDEDDGAVEALERRLELLDRLEIEMVRRLIEEQDVGVRAQDLLQPPPRRLSAREAGRVPLLCEERERAVAVTTPPSGSSSPASSRSSVDFPIPLGPTTPTRSPGAMVSDTPSMTTVPANDFLNELAASVGRGMA